MSESQQKQEKRKEKKHPKQLSQPHILIYVFDNL